MGKHILIAVVVSVLLSAVALGLVSKRSNNTLLSQQSQQVPDIRSQSLRTQAEKSGSVTATARPTNLRRYDAVNTLAQESNAIITGTVNSQTSQLLLPAEKLIVTDFKITVREPIKGALVTGQTISVRTPGGRVDFGDGKYAEVKMPDFWKYPEVGKLYVVFLESRTDGSFVLRGGPQGLFEINAAGTIKAQVRPEDKLAQNYDGKKLRSFLAEVRTANK